MPTDPRRVSARGVPKVKPPPRVASARAATASLPRPRKKFVHTFQFTHHKRPDPPSRVTYTIKRRQGVAWLTLVHDRFPGETPTYKSVRSGWPPILSALKSLLETGKPLWKG